ncbi:MAG: DUF2339 domain-containing protein [Candidatus Kapabacteria bacterium]|nr:DUF2339 domain-containing protein [Candidatus Kapabacteria bacterium]
MLFGFSPFSFLVSVLTVVIPWLVIMLLSSRIKRLQERLQHLERMVYGLQHHTQRTTDAVASETPMQQPTAPPPPPPPTAVHQPVPPPPIPMPIGMQGARPQPSPGRTRSRAEVELLVGGTWLSRIGAVALVIGTLFFLKYAFDNGWISEWMRVAIGLGVGSALLAGAERWHRRGLSLFAQGLAGAGIPILYLSVYAAYGFYHLLPQPAAVAAMCVVTAVSVFIGLRHDSLFIAIMAAVGGICTPWWLSTGHMHTTGLFGYVTVVACGLFAIAIMRPRWVGIAGIAYAGMWFWWLVWNKGRYTMASPDVVEGTVMASICLLLGVAFQYIVECRVDDNHQHLRRLLHGVHLTVMFAAVLYALDTLVPRENELATAIMGLLGIGMALLYRRMGASVASSMYAVAALFALTWCVGYETDAFVDAIGWSLIGITAIVVMRSVHDVPARITSLSIIALGLLAACMDERSTGITTASLPPVVNLRVAALVSAGLAAIIGTRLVPASASPWQMLLPVLRTGGYLAMVLCVHREVFDAITLQAHDLTIGHVGTDLFATLVARGHALAAMTSMVLASAFVVAHRWLRDEAAALAGIAAALLAAVWWLSHASDVPDPAVLQPFLSVRTLTGAVMTLALIPAVLSGLPSVTLVPPAVVRTALGVLLIAFSVAFCTIEVVWPETIMIHRLLDDGTAAERAAAWDRFHLRMSATWIVYAILLMALGFVRRIPAVRVGALVLLLLSICKVFLYDLSFLEQPYRIVSFIALGAILLVAGFMYQRFRHVILAAPSQPLAGDDTV